MAATDSVPTVFEWAQFVIVPIALAIIGILGQKVLKSTKESAKNSQDAADSVRPNGTGHKTLVHMQEDVLMHLGEIRGEVRSLHNDFVDHVENDRESFMEVRNTMEEMRGLFETMYEINKYQKQSD